MNEFICRPLCIILEERSKMRKKILDAVCTFLFVLCLIITSNISENETEEEIPKTTIEIRQVSESENINVRAGVCVAFSDYSFTTESDEEKGIEKKIVAKVATANAVREESEENSEKVETDTEIFSGAEREIETETEIETGTEIETESEEVIETVEYENRWGISLTEEEIDLLARIVWLEANGEPVEGQEAVVEVVFNRMASDLYPDTLYDVLSQGNPVQFVSWKNRDKAQPTEKEYDSIYNVLSGNTNLLRNDTMNFSTFMLTPNLDVQICCHYFCY